MIAKDEINKPSLSEIADQRFRPYPEYKDSGVEWLGEIPAHWEVRRLKTIASVELSNVDKKSVEDQISVRLCNYINVYYNERITNSVEFMSATATPEQAKRFALRVSDVLITKDSESWTDIAVPSVVEDELEGVLCGYHLALVRPFATSLDGRFLGRAFAAIGPRDQFQVLANGITRFGLSGDAIRTGVFPVPPLSEQRAIATFLDRETAKIDAMVAKKGRLVELLKEKRTALITRGVTKGLDPNSPMKDSGVEWLGEIPAHWEVWSVRNLLRCRHVEIQDGNHGELHPTADDYVISGIPFLMAKDIRENQVNLDRCQFITKERSDGLRIGFAKPGDVLLTHKGTIGSTAIVPDVIETPYVMLTPQVTYYRVKSTCLLRDFLHLQFQTDAFQEQMRVLAEGGTTRAYLGITAQRELCLVLPPPDEQRAVCNELVPDLTSFDQLIKSVRKGIDRLKEFRTALISAAVTGKIDVREEAA